MKIDTMTEAQFVQLFDHSLLRPENRAADFEKHIQECRTYGFYSAAVNSAQIPRYVEALAETGVKVGAAIGFPFGQASADAKAAEAQIALEEGADEIDYVLNIGRLLDGDACYIAREMDTIVAVCREHQAVSKVIFENCYLTEQAKRLACEIAVDTGIDFVKTSTGFGPSGATVEDIALMKKIVGNRVKIKAAGAMRTLADVASAVEAGAERIGSAFSVSILEEFKKAINKSECLKI